MHNQYQQPINENLKMPFNHFDDETLPESITDRVMFKHFMECMVNIAKNANNDLAVYHLEKASESFSQEK